MITKPPTERYGRGPYYRCPIPPGCTVRRKRDGSLMHFAETRQQKTIRSPEGDKMVEWHVDDVTGYASNTAWYEDSTCTSFTTELILETDRSADRDVTAFVLKLRTTGWTIDIVPAPKQG